MGPLISVIIPIHNTSRFLPRCMESIINSDCKNLEIICINDGSTDNCLEILQEYKNKDNRILLIDVPNGGVTKARNIGLDYTTGDYICFIDSDDWIHRQFFSALLFFLELVHADNADFCSSDEDDDYYSSAVDSSENNLDTERVYFKLIHQEKLLNALSQLNKKDCLLIEYVYGICPQCLKNKEKKSTRQASLLLGLTEDGAQKKLKSILKKLKKNLQE